MKSRNRLRHGPSQMSVMSYDAYSSKASNQVNFHLNSNSYEIYYYSLMIHTHSLIQHWTRFIWCPKIPCCPIKMSGHFLLIWTHGRNGAEDPNLIFAVVKIIIPEIIPILGYSSRCLCCSIIMRPIIRYWFWCCFIFWCVCYWFYAR